jgi:hypothetical protein
MSQCIRTVGILVAALVLVAASNPAAGSYGGEKVPMTVEETVPVIGDDALESRKTGPGDGNTDHRSIGSKAFDSKSDWVNFIVLLGFLYFYYSFAMAFAGLRKGSSRIPDLINPNWIPLLRVIIKKVMRGKKIIKTVTSMVRDYTAIVTVPLRMPFLFLA